ncbi:MAG: hypothetical protein ACOYOA_04845 [Saprospiraceae bacterium]
MIKYLFAFIFFTFSFSLLAQNDNEVPLDNSPFSRFGLGDFYGNNYAASSAFGSLTAAFNDPYHINALNPAASSFLKSTAYEVGIYGKHSTLRDNSKSAEIWSGHLQNLSIGFPLRNQINELLDRRQKSNFRHGMHLALLPYTSVGYNIGSAQRIPGVDSVQYAFQGNGGTYKLMWGNSIGYKNFSFGVNLGYLFGSIKNTKAITFNELTYGYQNDIKSDTRYSGFIWNAGAQYTYDLMKKVGSKREKSGKKITFGLYGNSNTNFKTNSSQVIRRINFDYSTSSSSFHSDTLFKERQSGVKASGKLPAEICFGAMFEKENKLRFGINMNSGFWNNYQNEIKPEILENTFSVSSGIEWTPEYNSYNKYLKRVRYRGGVHYGSDPRLIKGEQIKTTGFTFGLGLPLVMPRQQVSFVDVTFDIGKTGVSVLSENYAKVILGFTLNDNSWFYKRRFN